MNQLKPLVIGTLAVALTAGAALAAPSHMAPRAAAVHTTGTRSVGVHVVPHPERPMHATNNPPHQVIIHNSVTNKDENHAVVVDHRPGHIIGRDPRLRIVARGYRSPHNWGHFHVGHGGWFHLWGITAWDTVGTVTCEAANEATGELFPVSEDRDSRGWDDETVNSVLDQALDDCMAAAGGAQCDPATPSCSFQDY